GCKVSLIFCKHTGLYCLYVDKREREHGFACFYYLYLKNKKVFDQCIDYCRGQHYEEKSIEVGDQLMAYSFDSYGDQQRRDQWSTGQWKIMEKTGIENEEQYEN